MTSYRAVIQHNQHVPRAALIVGALVALACAVNDKDNSRDDGVGVSGASGSGGAAKECPADLPGPALVKVSSPSGSSYCIDTTEVTKGQYGAFLETSPSADAQSAECAWNSGFVPMKLCCEVGAEPDWPFPAGEENKPVAWVNWCQANVFCKWAGKRLCGRVGGGANTFDDYKDPERSQWFNACSAGGTLAFPYGNEFAPGSCESADANTGTAFVMESSQCKGSVAPFDRIFDMSGNVSEWEDSCTTDALGVACHARGGGMNIVGPTEAEKLGCDTDVSPGIRQVAAGLGFRCCADL